MRPCANIVVCSTLGCGKGVWICTVKEMCCTALMWQGCWQQFNFFSTCSFASVYNCVNWKEH